MNNNYFFATIVIPIISSMISAMAGAGLGGWFATRLAQKTYATDILNEGLAYITVFQHIYDDTISALAKLTEQTAKYHEIRSTRSDNEAFRFLGNLHEGNEAVLAKLDTFTRYWQEYKVKVILCKSKHICKNGNMRKKFDVFVSKMETAHENIKRYESLVKSYQQKINNWEKDKTGSFPAYNVLCSTKDHFEAAVEQAKKLSGCLTELGETIYSFSMSNPH